MSWIHDWMVWFDQVSATSPFLGGFMVSQWLIDLVLVSMILARRK